MGCRSSKYDLTTTHDHSLRDAFHCTKNTDVDLVIIDPDLGWRQIQSNLIFVQHCPPSISSSDLSNDWYDKYGNKDTALLKNQELYPIGWKVNFMNDRSGNYCETLLVTLSLNIAIRAEELAQHFGVLYNGMSGETFQSNTSLINSKSDLSKRKIYEILGIPDFEWILLSRRDSLAAHVKKSPAYHKNHPFFRKKAFFRDSSDSMSSSVCLQLLQNKTDCDTIKKVIADVPAIGMNIAEQLYRLERKRNSRHFMPTNTFGWKFLPQYKAEPSHFDVSVVTPNGDIVQFVPEELIMNITQWVQQTYLTSVLL